MQPIKDRTASFIVRIWAEPNADAPSGFEWRGRIECVDTGARRFFLDLGVIPHFIAECLEAPPTD